MSELNPDGKAPRDLVADLAVHDPDFRARLVADPRTALKDTLGIDLGDDVTVSVLEDSPSRVHVVIPAVDDSLEEAEMESVVGGLRIQRPSISPTRIRPITVTQWHGCLTCV